MTTKVLKIGTRGSPLALAQANDVKAKLLAAHTHLTSDDVTITVISTAGDRILDRHLMQAGGKGLFTREIEDALLKGDIDLAVHSCKDMPTILPDGLVLAAFLEREDPRDVFLTADGRSFASLPEGATVGTASLRRRAQALAKRPDLNIITFRGNVDTRIRKLKEGEAEGTFLARAGLNRLGRDVEDMETLSADEFLPAPAQGIVTIETRAGDAATQAALKPLDHSPSRIAAEVERTVLRTLDGSCRTPIGAHAQVADGQVSLRAQLLSVDGQTLFEEAGRCPAEEAVALAKELATKIRTDAGEAFFETLKKEAEAAVA